MHDLSDFTLSDMTACSAALRKMDSEANSLEEVARRISRYLYENLADRRTGERACAMVRLYKTHPLEGLGPNLRDFVRARLGGNSETPSMRCLVLLATCGERPEWNDRAKSARHRAIPLPSEKMVDSFPMISQLIRQFGVEIGAVVKPDPALILHHEQRTYNVFHVPEALGSPCVPAQDDFVIPYRIRSVLGFGGMLPTADLFAIIIFSKVSIPRETADLFRTLALSAKVALLPFLRSAACD